MAYEAQILMGIMIFLAFMGFMSAIMPTANQNPMTSTTGYNAEYNTTITNYKQENNFGFSTLDFGIFGASLISVASACVLTTGIPCGIALGVYGFINGVLFIATSSLLWILFIPFGLVLTYIIARLARGGG
jgi:hypothetical protein